MTRTILFTVLGWMVGNFLWAAFKTHDWTEAIQNSFIIGWVALMIWFNLWLDGWIT